MKKLTIQEIANATHARILAANLEEAQQKTICHVTQDSRQAGEESLFVPLKGKNSGSTIITFNYTYIVGGSVNTGSQKVEVLVGQPAKTYYQLKFESIGNGIFE